MCVCVGSVVAGAIAAGIIVPVAVLALIIVGVVTYFYYKRKKTRGSVISTMY